MQHRFNNVMANSSPISSAQNQQQMQIGGGTNNGNEIVQHQILNEIQRFESVHPCIYRIYDLVEKIENDQIANLIRQQVISIEDAFVNSQEWTLSRMINEIRLGVIGSEDSCKNSLIHYFLTRNWNWEDAPEGGRFKKEVMVDGRSFLLLIRDEGSREPTLQFSQWLDALLIVFTLDSRKSFQYALELQQLVNNFRSLDGGEMPIYLVGMKNMSNMGHQQMVSEEEAQRIAKTRKMCNYFECLDGSNVQRMFNNVCQRVVQQRSSSRVSSFIGRTNMGLSHEFVAPGDPMLASMSSASFLPAGRPSSYHQHQRSISVLPINSDQQQQPIGHHIHAPSIPSRGRTPRYEDVPMPPTHFHPPPAHLRTQQSFTPGSVGYYSSNNEAAVGGRKRESIDWQSRPIAVSPFATPNAPSCSAVLGGQCGNGNNNNPMGEQLAAISPAYSHSSLSSSHYQISGANNTMTATPYARSASNMPGGAGGHHSHPHRPCSDPSSQSPLFFDSRQPHHQQLLAHPLSNATSSSTLVVNNGNGNGSTANLLPTPGSTPKTERKGKRISNIFRKEHIATPDERIAKSSAEINMGIGRAIPVKQGQLYKRTKNGLNKEWKKKYVCLYSDGRICYHQNLKDYMEKDSRAKEIYLGLATVRTSDRHRNRGGGNNRNSMLPTQKEAKSEWPCEPGNEAEDIRSPTGELSEGVSDGCSVENNATGGFVTSTTSSSILVGSGDKEKAGKKEKAKEKKKRAKRVGSGVKNDEEEEKCEFEIVSCDQKHWEFSAPTVEERDQWVMCIEREIEKCLQQQLSLKDQQQLNNGSRNGQHFSRNNAGGNAEKRREHIQALRRIDGNDRCADCSAQQPQWASINLGTLICIECSGIHRKLGSHISKVRSLELDDWPPEHLVVMQAIGNTLANQVWEHNALPKDKPGPDSTREQKEHWIRLKYEEKLYLPPIPVDRTLSQQLVDAVLSRSIRQLLMVLPRCTKLEVNAPIGGQNEDRRTALHLACGIGAPEILQLLIWYNADIRALDEQGRSALWHAQVNGSSECAAILIQAGLRPDEECPGGGAVDSGFSEAYRGSSSNNAADNR